SVWENPAMMRPTKKNPGRSRPAKPSRTARPEGRRRNPPPADAARAPERGQKILAPAGLAHHRDAEEWIRAGRVTVNGEVATLGTRARGSDKVRLDGHLVHQAPARRAATWLCHRSPGENLLPPREDDDAATGTASRDALSQ